MAGEDLARNTVTGMARFNPVTLIPLLAQRGQLTMEQLMNMLKGRQAPTTQGRQYGINEPLPRFGGVDPITGQPIIIPPEKKRK